MFQIPIRRFNVSSYHGTLSLEFLDQVLQLDTLIVPISGGGLIFGFAIGAKAINPAIRVVAAEPKGGNNAAQSKASGRIITPVVRDLVEYIITVEDKEIVEAMRYCYEILI
ncbi:serine racemase [Tanacetum coccineum]